MKKKYSLITLALIICGCQQTELMVPDRGPVTSFKVVSANAASGDTRTTLDGLEVSWAESDKIGVYDASATIKEFTAVSAGRTVSFTGLAENSETGTYYGIYPYDGNGAWENGGFISLIPSNQYSGGSTTNWDPKAPIAAGICDSEDMIMPFYNAHALIKIVMPTTVPNNFKPNVVTIRGSADEPLAGYVKVIPGTEPDGPTVTMHANAANTITYHKEGYFAPGEDFYISALAQDLSGLTVYISGDLTYNGITTGGMVMIKSKTEQGSISLNQNRIRLLDFSQLPILDPGTPYEMQNNNHGTVVLMVSKDGGSVMALGYNASYHADTWQTLIYEADLSDPITTWTKDDTLEWHKVSDIPSYVWRFKKGAYKGKYLGYSVEKQASYLVSSQDLAAEYIMYDTGEKQ